ncbi:serine protease, partial [Myxococcota bacterium]|nr:serine protease [Myxococcota bacterium]
MKLFTVTKKPNHYQPWDLEYQRNSGGSGCILEGKRILTNAHVVSDQVYVQVLKMGDSRKYSARVAYVDHDSETAIIEVEDERFFDDTIPVRFGELPFRQDKVAVYGFPIGGNELSITEGVVSRLEVLRYTHSQRDLLAIQTDAAINPGNSGGPVFMNGAMVGIAFQAHTQKEIEKTGYVVPISVIRHFLRDVDDGKVDGVPA